MLIFNNKLTSTLLTNIFLFFSLKKLLYIGPHGSMKIKHIVIIYILALVCLINIGVKRCFNWKLFVSYFYYKFNLFIIILGNIDYSDSSISSNSPAMHVLSKNHDSLDVNAAWMFVEGTFTGMLKLLWYVFFHCIYYHISISHYFFRFFLVLPQLTTFAAWFWSCCRISSMLK